MKILILGTLPKDEKRTALYKSMISVCEKFGRVSSPLDTAKFQGNETERYERAFRKVKETGLIIGEQSEPSTGQGMEIREAANLNKPIVVVAKQGSKVSGLVKGCPTVKEIIYYETNEDLETKLEEVLKRF